MLGCSILGEHRELLVPGIQDEEPLLPPAQPCVQPWHGRDIQSLLHPRAVSHGAESGAQGAALQLPLSTLPLPHPRYYGELRLRLSPKH